MTEDCRSKEGSVVGVVDALITLSRVFREKTLETSLGSHPAVRAALLDLAADEGFALLRHEMAHAEAWHRRERGEKLLAAATDAARCMSLLHALQCAHCGSRNIVPDSDTGDATCGDCRRSDGVVEMTEDQWTRK